MKGVMFLVMFPILLIASPWSSVKNGIKEYERGNFEKALENFQNAQLDDPISPIVHYNMASALYKQKKYDKAVHEYQKAAEKARDNHLLAKIWYGLGNSYFQSDSLLKAIECYKKSLEYDPDDKDAKYNLELARALLKELAKKEEQPQAQAQQSQGGAQHQQSQQPQPDTTGTDTTQKGGSGEKKEEISKEDAERILNLIDQSDKNLQNQRELPIRGGEYHEKDW